MFLERQTVSRKTPGDGKLEISAGAAEHLQMGRDALEVEVGMLCAPAHVEVLECTCQKIGRAHEHHFVVSELLKSLPAAALVDLQVAAIGEGNNERTRVTVLPVDGSTA